MEGAQWSPEPCSRLPDPPRAGPRAAPARRPSWRWSWRRSSAFRRPPTRPTAPRLTLAGHGRARRTWARTRPELPRERADGLLRRPPCARRRGGCSATRMARSRWSSTCGRCGYAEARAGRRWTPRRAADGTVTPGATRVGLVFSGGGGTGALARLSHDGKELALGWPGRLPVPVLSGDTASYRDVLAGVDLIVRADVEGFSELLVVKDATAAANPALASVRFSMAAEGVSVRQAADGSLAAVDTAGQTVFEAPAPHMWDSASGGGDGRRRPMRVEVGSGELTVVPDQAMLTGKDTHFPVFI